MCFKYSLFQAKKRERRGLLCHFRTSPLLEKEGWVLVAAPGSVRRSCLVEGWPHAPPANISSPITVSHLTQGTSAQSTSLVPASKPAGVLALGWVWPLGPCRLDSGWRFWESREQVPSQHGNKWEVSAVPLITCQNINKEKRCHQEQYYVLHSGKQTNAERGRTCFAAALVGFAELKIFVTVSHFTAVTILWNEDDTRAAYLMRFMFKTR